MFLRAAPFAVMLGETGPAFSAHAARLVSAGPSLTDPPLVLHIHVRRVSSSHSAALPSTSQGGDLGRIKMDWLLFSSSPTFLITPAAFHQS